MKMKLVVAAILLAFSACLSLNATEVVLHVTGSSAFRKAFVQSVEDQMNGSGTYVVAYEGSGTTVAGTETGAGDVVLRGTINGQAVTVKCTWAGSVGGIFLVAAQVGITSIPGADGWMSITNLPTSGSTSGGAIVTGNQTLLSVASPSLSLDTATFSSETQNADVCMSDSLQASTVFFRTPVLPAASNSHEVVGVVPFEWVANNGAQSSLQTSLTSGSTNGTATISVTSTAGVNVNAEITGTDVPVGTHVLSVLSSTQLLLTASATGTHSGLTFTHYFANPISTMNANQANQLLEGGLYLSQLTGKSSDSSTFVYAMGGNFDSGARLAAMNESGLGTGGAPQQMVPNDANTGSNGAAGTPAPITSFALTPPVNIYPGAYTQFFDIGQDGFASGAVLAGWLQQTGSYGAGPTVSDVNSGCAPLYDINSGGFGTGGWLVGCLGRNDANAAVSTSAGPNTAHRVMWNGKADWPAAAGAVAVLPSTGYVDSNIEQGFYTFWEYEHFLAKNGGVSAGQQAVCDGIYTQLTGTTVGGDTAYGSADTPLSGILTQNMAVSKVVEGGIITHN